MAQIQIDIPKLEEQAYNQGKEHGYQIGYSDGYAAGWDAAQKVEKNAQPQDVPD